MLVLHRAKLLASNQSVLALGVAPSGVRAAAPHSARHGRRACMPKCSMQGRIQVVEQSRCRTHRQQTTTIAQMQSQLSIHSPSPRGRGLGLGIENSHCFIKNRLSPKLKKPRFRIKNRGFILLKSYSLWLYRKTYHQHRRKYFPYRQGINNFVSVSVQLH